MRIPNYVEILPLALIAMSWPRAAALPTNGMDDARIDVSIKTQLKPLGPKTREADVVPVASNGKEPIRNEGRRKEWCRPQLWGCYGHEDECCPGLKCRFYLFVW